MAPGLTCLGKHWIAWLYAWASMHLYMCVFVCERERETESHDKKVEQWDAEWRFLLSVCLFTLSVSAFSFESLFPFLFFCVCHPVVCIFTERASQTCLAFIQFTLSSVNSINLCFFAVWVSPLDYSPTVPFTSFHLNLHIWVQCN